jgi:hypothetical protein
LTAALATHAANIKNLEGEKDDLELLKCIGWLLPRLPQESGNMTEPKRV